MDFDPNDNVVKLCLQGVGMEELGQADEERRQTPEQLQDMARKTGGFESEIINYS